MAKQSNLEDSKHGWHCLQMKVIVSSQNGTKNPQDIDFELQKAAIGYLTQTNYRRV